MMRKLFSISILLLVFITGAEAQKKFVYEDTLLLQRDEPVSTTTTTTEVKIVENATTYDDESAAMEDAFEIDTVLNQNYLNLPYDSVKNWKNSKDYAYINLLDSLLRRKDKEELQTQSNRSSTPRPAGGGFLNNILGSSFMTGLLVTLAILFVFFIIYRLFLADGAFKRKTKAVKTAEVEEEEEIITKESDFDRLIRLALQNGNFRQAVRYQYLRTLHILAEKNFLELAPDKTNFNYVNEIANHDHRNAFAALTLNYEYVWYGEFNIEKDIYQKIENNFINLNQKL